jgi:plasmid rolling circle replication initiator protein Rep
VSSVAGNLEVINMPQMAFLSDQNTGGKERPWKKWKLASQRASAALIGWDSQPAMKRWGERLRDCSTFLEFNVCPDGDGKWLNQANFCRVRVCPMCMWRRSKVLTNQVLTVAHTLASRQKVRWLLLTLTVRNVLAGFEASETPELVSQRLSDALYVLGEGFNRLTRQRFWNKSVLGYYRTVEITRNLDERSWQSGSLWYGSYHPHVHVLLAVRPSYFSTGYVKQAEWVSRWEKAAKLDYDAVVDIRPLRPKGKTRAEVAQMDEQDVLSGVLEATKYLTKPNFLAPGVADVVSRDTLRTIALAVRGRKLTGWGGVLRDIRHELMLEDVEGADADLVHDADSVTDGCKCPVCQSDLYQSVYRWHMGHKNYVGGGASHD